MNGERRVSLVTRDTEPSKKDLQVRVYPSELRFLDAEVGKVYRLSVILHNVGRVNHKIRFQQPSQRQFRLLMSNLDKSLASGLQLTAVVEYHPNKNEDLYDNLFIYIGSRTVTIPLIGMIPACQLQVDQLVDFGKLVANSRVHCKEVNIFNHGKAPGLFRAEYDGELPIVISPTSGTVMAMSSLAIKVDFCTSEARVVNEVVKMSLQGHPDILLNIKAHVVHQIIQLLSVTTGKPLKCINFGSTFFGTSKLEQIYIYNNSPESVTWVAILQDDTVGEEVATNVLQRTDVALNNLSYLSKIKNIDVSNFITCTPNEGRLKPYQKTRLTFCFSPKLLTDDTKKVDPAHRQDYALFLRFECVGSKDGYLRDDINKEIRSDQYNRVELALTGTGLPVILQFFPGKVFTFPPCSVGSQIDLLCTIHNQCRYLPVTCHFKKAAHFKIEPKQVDIDAASDQKVICSFIPHQIGIFKVRQTIEIIGLVASENFLSASLKPFHEVYMYFKSVGRHGTKIDEMAINTGLTPLISSPAPQLVVKNVIKQDSKPVAVLPSAQEESPQDPQGHRESFKNSLIPSDQSGNTAPRDHKIQFRLNLAKPPRFNCLDPEFELTDLEKVDKEDHKNFYSRYTDCLRALRIQKQSQREFLNPSNKQPISDLLKSTTSSGRDEDLPPELLIKHNRMITTKQIITNVKKALKKKVVHGLKSEPSTPLEISHCSIILTPKQIHQVIIGPSVLNYGDICVHSINSQLINIINILPIYIFIHFDVQLKELQKTKQFSYVIPPTSCTYIPLLFHSTTVGKFWKSFTFNVNSKPAGHILVMAVVHPVNLKLSSNEIILKPQGFLMKRCFRQTVCMHNPNNYFARFEWEPVIKKGMAFSINPTKGLVEPFSSLECEVTWTPGFSSLEQGELILKVPEGNTTTLKCIAEPGQSKVAYREPRVIFSHAPQGLTTWKTAVLHNVGESHAYFRVCEKDLSPHVRIVPAEGIVPFRGNIVLNVSLTTSVLGPFDTKAKIAIHRADTLYLGISGTIVIPDIVIKPATLKFIGTYIGSTHIFPVLIINRGTTRARLTFNMEGHEEFSVHYKDESVKISEPEFPHIYFLELDAGTNLECGIEFAPRDVAAHSFTLHVMLNSFKASELHALRRLKNIPLLSRTTPLTKLCHIQATGLQAPLTFSKTDFVFEIPIYDLDSNNNNKRSEDLIIYNISKKTVQWSLDIHNTNNLFTDGIFNCSRLAGVLLEGENCKVTIVFQPTRDGIYVADIPILLDDNPVIYRTLSITGEVKSPKLRFDPPFVIFTPVPLDVIIGLDIIILPKNYYRNSSVKVDLPKVRVHDGEELSPLSVRFPNGPTITGSPTGINPPLTCRLSFRSSKSVSLFMDVRYGSEESNWFPLPVSATAENCILTIYPYMALHIDEQKIVLKDDDNANLLNENLTLFYRDNAFLNPRLSKCEPSPITNRRRLSVVFVGMEVTYEHSKLLKTQKITKDDDETVVTEEENKQFYFPNEGTKAHTFFQKIVNATQTWFSLFGWPGGPHSLSIPETARKDVYKVKYCSPISFKNFCCQNTFSKYNKTIYDSILHLSGIMPPGIDSKQSLPVNRTAKVVQLYSQHSSLLNFLKIHGACISHVQPEFLLEPEDYDLWLKLISSNYPIPNNPSMLPKRHSVIIEKSKFELWSKRAWTDVFLQIYKILILSRVRPQTNKNLPRISVKAESPKVNPCFISSNMYSNYERILLSWLNTNFESARQIIWKSCCTGLMPCERWIVNFDTDLSDGLVLATQLGAYCPFLIDTFLVNMYTHPQTSEQYLHNCLIIVNVLHEIGFEMDIQATDICDPNPIMMLMLCAYMYERLPTYLPRKSVIFRCSLHDTTRREIMIKNPSARELVYNAMIRGRDAADFSTVPKGEDTFKILPRRETTITVEYNSRFIHPAEALLMLISKTEPVVGGITLTFGLRGELLKFKKLDIIKCISPCYTWKHITLNVKNPFRVAGEFRVILLESSTFISLPAHLHESRRLLNQMDDESSLFLEPSKSTSCDRDLSEGCTTCSDSLKTSIKCNFVREFFCPKSALNLPVKGSTLDLFFLPFEMHLRYCIVILSSRKIGEILYILEGKGIIPLPSHFPKPVPIQHNLNSSDEAFNKDDPVLYLKCKLGEILRTDILFPLMNDAKERAFAFAAKQQMSRMEYDRRSITGTLESSSVRVAIALLGLTKVECSTYFNTSQLKRPKTILYSVEISFPEYFSIPSKIYIPQIPESRTEHSELHGLKLEHKSEPDASIAVPLQFFPLSAGRYPCEILLKSKYDVRIFQIEGVVDEERAEGRFEFQTRAFEAITQNIPVINRSDKDWKCRAEIQGDWFSGPSVIHIESQKIKDYPLTFKPILECEIMGKLILINEVDTSEHVFEIKGVAKSPLPTEKLFVDCRVGNEIRRTITVPNYTKTALTYKVVSDLSMVWGAPFITVEANSKVPYALHIKPKKSGKFTGKIIFTVVDKEDIISQRELYAGQYDSYIGKIASIPSSMLVKSEQVSALKNLKFWYSVDINSVPGYPTHTLEIECISLERQRIDIPLCNTQARIFHIDVLLSSPALSGSKEIVLFSEEQKNYSIFIIPVTTGYSEEKVIFQPEDSREFWYLLKLKTKPPKPTTIAEIQCELGKFVSQIITLNNPSHETLVISGQSTNPINFVLDMSKGPLIIDPFSTGKISFKFCPSSLGRNNQRGSLIFSCSQIEEWTFNVSGVGLYPTPISTEKASTFLDTHKTITIPFQNPTLEEVIIDITLSNRDKTKKYFLDPKWSSFFSRSSGFKFSKSMTQTQGIKLPPKGTIDITMIFYPRDMKLYKSLVIIQMIKANNELWHIDNFNELNSDMKRNIGTDRENIAVIQWLYPFLGLSEAEYPQQCSEINWHCFSPPAVLKGKAKKRIEDVLVVSLDGDYSRGRPIYEPNDFVVLPENSTRDSSYEDLLGICHQSNRMKQNHYILIVISEQRMLGGAPRLPEQSQRPPRRRGVERSREASVPTGFTLSPSRMMPSASGRPKGRTTAYEYFLQACRQELREQNIQLTVDYHRFLRDCEHRWNVLDTEEKERFKKMAKADGRRYRRQKRRYDPTWAAKRDPEDSKRPKSGFIFYQEHQPQICFDNPRMAMKQVAKEIGQIWRQMSASEKHPCQDRAEYEAKKRRSVGATAGRDKDQKNLEEEEDYGGMDKMEGDNDEIDDDQEQDEEDGEENEEGEEDKASVGNYSSSEGKYIQDKRQFKFKVEFESEDIKSRVEPYFTVYLLDKAFNISIEQITLMFALIFIPMKPVRTRINLKIESEIDGIWRYPIFLNVEQPDVDGIVDIEAVGLNKESSVELRLKSTSRNPQPFTAYFLSKTSDEIFVIPDKGVIQPHQSETGIITIGFKPCDYGKIYKAELAIEMEDEYWLYEVNGIPPPSGPSKDTKAKVDCRNKAYDNKTTKVNNFIQKNVKLVKAKLSCTSKDSPLTLKNK
ncbi:cilia- and flagella-associated protein 47 [Suncus etruscus]|uniref:cilia- and flagella-associated protein 47 n=1 Tax=Suncus etruscus TaxID=109475 RepID=UPI00210F708B|nr:cilia- and flagella-associated protein 47 [Suncus etruscus]